MTQTACARRRLRLLGARNEDRQAAFVRTQRHAQEQDAEKGQAEKGQAGQSGSKSRKSRKLQRAKTRHAKPAAKAGATAATTASSKPAAANKGRAPSGGAQRRAPNRR